MRLNKRLLTILLVAAALALAGCDAPEGRRERGGGPGGDIGNWGEPPRMHGESHPITSVYYETPLEGKGIEASGHAGSLHP